MLLWWYFRYFGCCVVLWVVAWLNGVCLLIDVAVDAVYCWVFDFVCCVALCFVCY